ncbi:MAG: hypothetical protein EBZ50_00525 [Alphaproteobacteria bacterium]|nr:hypothetical protein [Alphaproteobacteria bacterium]
MNGHSPFQAARTFWLGEEPVAQEADKLALARARRVALARSLCRFHRMSFPSSVSSRAIAQAARVFAETNAPFAETDFLIVRGRASASIWWWDRSAVAAALGDARVYRTADFVPETLLQLLGDGARCVALTDGFEAQIWEDGELIATSWRRRPFTDDQWAAFALTSGASGAAARPTAVNAGIDPAGRMLARVVRAPLDWSDLQNVALWAGAVALVAASALAGAGWSWSRQAASAAAEGERIEAARKADPAIAKARADLATISTFRAQTNGGGALGAAAHGLSVFRTLDVAPRAWSVEKRILAAEWDISSAAAPVNTIAAALEADPMFARVAPRIDTDEGRARLTADVVAPSQGTPK